MVVMALNVVRRWERTRKHWYRYCAYIGGVGRIVEKILVPPCHGDMYGCVERHGRLWHIGDGKRRMRVDWLIYVEVRCTDMNCSNMTWWLFRRAMYHVQKVVITLWQSEIRHWCNKKTGLDNPMLVRVLTVHSHNTINTRCNTEHVIIVIK